MKAIQLRRFGNPDVLDYIDVPTPVPGPGEVLVQVHAAGVNFADTLMRQDRYAITPPLSAILGSEVAGTIAALGVDVDANTIAIGTRVAAPLFAANISLGGYAEFVVVPVDYIVPLPDNLSFDQATALMVQGLTAAYLIKQVPPAGKTVLATGAAGGVGSFLVQLARQAGARHIVAAASSEQKLAFTRSLGADVGIDYTDPHWTVSLNAALGGAGPDIIYESVGGTITMDGLAALAPLGQMVIYGALNIQQFALGVPDLLGLIFKNQSITGFALVPLLTPGSLKRELGALFDDAAQGLLTVTIGGVYPLADAADAHRALEARNTIGKLILVP
ncbi:zinc-binding dehydrogenase [Sphingobium sp. CECT 9361]|uniref:quinone oxidoreductase family protein n=1 Tax=Sphingobium sp. CECT 9361 TaxID=2845384 RepID=UPI001E51C924|nr:zinc-binding dehydrogenase [Sphingobium sp. CECT 9361]CAH0352143.1 2-haloacrylate reductase [Sphingobium sp. CECT 9361]